MVPACPDGLAATAGKPALSSGALESVAVIRPSLVEPSQVQNNLFEPRPAASISLDSVSVGAGQLATITVTLTSSAGLAAGDLAVRFDGNLLTPIRAETTPQSQGFLFATSIMPGRMAVSLAKSTAVADSPGPVLHLIFEVRADAPVVTIPINWSKAELFGPGLTPLDTEMIPGAIRVIIPGQPEHVFNQIVRQPDGVELNFSTSHGWDYEVLFSGPILNGTWRPLGPKTAGCGSIMRVTDAISPRSRFYRIQVSMP
jgi:hypothetical protein